MGVFYYAKSSGNFGPNVNGTVRPGGPGGNFPVNKWFTLRSGPAEIVVHFQKFSFPVPLQHVTIHSTVKTRN